jgi:hypothetical protein
MADNGDFSFNWTQTGLSPGTSYYFRVRAFNGFGPSSYTYKTFTTRTKAPDKPMIIRVSSESVTLRWVFSKGFFRRVEQLMEIFDHADSSGDGKVDREELTAMIDECASGSKALRSFLEKVAAERIPPIDLRQVLMFRRHFSYCDYWYSNLNLYSQSISNHYVSGLRRAVRRD